MAPRACILFSATALLAQAPDKSFVIGSNHDLSVAGPGPITSPVSDACVFCHTPHTSAMNVTPLWNHKLSIQNYNTYTSSTYQSGAEAPSAGISKLCLSCHDGTVAIGQTSSKGLITTTGSLPASANFGTNLAVDHPLGMSAVDDGQLATSLFQNPPSTKDPKVQLSAGRTECTTCHDAHRQNGDTALPDFLVRPNSGGAICLACHDPGRAQPNWMNGWSSGAHATAANTVPKTTGFGPYATVAANACSNCHGSHNDPLTSAQRLLRAAEEADCAPCHSGANVSPPAPNIMSELNGKPYRHPVTTVAGKHDAAENVAPLNGSRHSECADCHNSHAAAASGGALGAPGTEAALLGASGYDGTTVLRPAANEYQVCYKCHADSTNKPSNSGYGRTAVRPLPATDPLNVRLKFLASTVSHHNVATPREYDQIRVPSLRPYMLNLDGSANFSKPIGLGTQIYCTDCHSNDQARKSNGSGPNGPHGSRWTHLLELPYIQEPGFSYSSGLSGSAALCNKCHDVDGVVLQPSKSNFPLHWHVTSENASCSTCHDPHGVVGGTTINNYALINFDTSIVSGQRRFVRTQAGGQCYLTCHGEGHSPETYTRQNGH